MFQRKFGVVCYKELHVTINLFDYGVLVVDIEIPSKTFFSCNCKREFQFNLECNRFQFRYCVFFLIQLIQIHSHKNYTQVLILNISWYNFIESVVVHDILFTLTGFEYYFTTALCI